MEIFVSLSARSPWTYTPSHFASLRPRDKQRITSRLLKDLRCDIGTFRPTQTDDLGVVVEVWDTTIEVTFSLRPRTVKDPEGWTFSQHNLMTGAKKDIALGYDVSPSKVKAMLMALKPPEDPKARRR